MILYLCGEKVEHKILNFITMKTFFSLLTSFFVSFSLCFAEEVNVGHHVESDGFVWNLTVRNDTIEATDDAGNVILPAERGYSDAHYIPIATDLGKKVANTMRPFFIVYKKIDDVLYLGGCNPDGREVVPTLFKSVLAERNKDFLYYTVFTHDGTSGAFLDDGRCIVKPIYTSYVILFKDRFQIIDANATSFPVSNKISDYLQQQNLLNTAYDNGVNTDAFVMEGDSLLKLNNLNGAIAKYTEAIKKKPSANTYARRGMCYYKKENWKDALEDFRFALYLDDCTPEYYSLSDSLLYKAEDHRIEQLVRRQERLERAAMVLNAVSAGLNAASQSLSTIQSNSSNSKTGYTTNTTVMNSYGNNQNVSDNSNSGNAHRHNAKRCTQCQGDGKCRGNGNASKYHCRGTGKCTTCNGEGHTYVTGDKIVCAICHGNGKCSFCGGSGQCQRCKGKGTL